MQPEAANHLKPLGKLKKALDEERLEEDYSQNHDDGREVDSAEKQRYFSSYGIKHRVGYGIEKPYDRVERIWVDPGNNSAGYYHPHIKTQRNIQYFSNGGEKIFNDEHEFYSLLGLESILLLKACRIGT
jgi:hypothetical protein